MIAEIKDYIATCPLFRGNKINVNYLGDKPASYSIDSIPTDPVIKQYIDGGKLCQELFVLASTELYTQSIKDNTKVVKFYEDFSKWVDSMNKQKNLPQLPKPCTAHGIEVLTSQYLFDSGTSSARYQIQCRLIYYKEL